MDILRRDVAFAIRSLLRDRAFSIAAVATLALGVGAITTLAAVVAGVLLAPLPYRQPDRLVTILHGRSVSGPVSPADFDDIRRDDPLVQRRWPPRRRGAPTSPPTGAPSACRRCRSRARCLACSARPRFSAARSPNPT